MHTPGHVQILTVTLTLNLTLILTLTLAVYHASFVYIRPAVCIVTMKIYLAPCKENCVLSTLTKLMTKQ